MQCEDACVIVFFLLLMLLLFCFLFVCLFLMTRAGHVTVDLRPETDVFGDADVDNFSDWSRPSHVTVFWKKTTMYVSCMYL